MSIQLECDSLFIGEFKNTFAHEITPLGLLVSKFDTLYLIEDLENPKFEKIGSIKLKPYMNIGRSRIADRLFNFSIQHAFYIKDMGFVALNSYGWWKVSFDGAVIKLKPPFVGRLMARSGCLANNGRFYVAEYKKNQKRRETIIYSTSDFKDFEPAYCIPKLTIRHIHAIIKDTGHASRLWVLTGDYDKECFFLYTDDYFLTINQLPCHGQKTRATDILVDNHKLLWGMDSPVAQSAIQTWGPDFSKSPEQDHVLPGPAYYMACNEKGHIFIGTTVEPGPATKNNKATLWGKINRSVWQQLAVFSSDLAPQYAIIYFPRNKLPRNFLIFSVRGVKRYDGKMFIYKIN